MSKFLGDLVVKLVEDSEAGLWELVQPLSYQSEVANLTIQVPVGFQTDFCSVPRVPFAFMILGDRARMSGTVHDYLYSTHLVSRQVADRILQEMVQVDGLGKVAAGLFYAAVRVGGRSHW